MNACEADAMITGHHPLQDYVNRWIVILCCLMISVVEWFARLRRSETEPNAVYRRENALSRHLYARAAAIGFFALFQSFLCAILLFMLLCVGGSVIFCAYEGARELR